MKDKCLRAWSAFRIGASQRRYKNGPHTEKAPQPAGAKPLRRQPLNCNMCQRCSTAGKYYADTQTNSLQYALKEHHHQTQEVNNQCSCIQAVRWLYSQPNLIITISQIKDDHVCNKKVTDFIHIKLLYSQTGTRHSFFQVRQYSKLLQTFYFPN